jgi:hypothetical protein
MMQNSRISYQPENGRKARYLPMQKSDAFGGRVRWRVSRSAAQKVASPLSTKPRHSQNPIVLENVGSAAFAHIKTKAPSVA